MKNVIKVLAILAVATAIITVAAALTHRTDYTDYTEVKYTVKSGDTLWAIAANNCFAEGCSEAYDIREVIEIIKDINHTTSLIYPGDKLILPYYSK